MRIRDSLVLGCIFSVLALALTLAPAYAQNLVVNPGFESGDLTGWEVVGETAEATVSVQSSDNGPSEPGTHHALLDNRATEFHQLTLRTSTAPGSVGPGTFEFSADIKTGEVVGDTGLEVVLHFEQAGGGVIQTYDYGFYAPVGWFTFSNSFDIPENADFVTIEFIAFTTFGKHLTSMLLDNVSFVVVKPTAVTSKSWGDVKARYR